MPRQQQLVFVAPHDEPYIMAQQDCDKAIEHSVPAGDVKATAVSFCSPV